MLERAKAPPKKFLSREQEVKLSGDLRELYSRLLPSRESDQRRAVFVQKLERFLNEQWPESEIKVHVFGSSGNLLCTSDSDGKVTFTNRSFAGINGLMQLISVLPHRQKLSSVSAY